jgi:thiamine pyrophosphate-dependent acetolactate synthase large subunit-like protein
MAEIIAALDIPYVALNPGASFRGLHDSLVNHPERKMPELIECTHEEISVAVAHGYAKASGKPMAAAIHNLVGLQHASMAIFNAWCDRVPIYLLGGTGPMEIEKRRPWIDWIHTALVQGNIIRDFVKWDDQPASLHGLADSLYRGYRLMMNEPAAPVYVCLDAGLQETALSEEEYQELLALNRPPENGDFISAISPAPPPEALNRIAAAIREAEWPVIIADHAGRADETFIALSDFSRKWAIPVVDRGGRLNLPTNHPMNLTFDRESLQKADVVIALDVRDLFGAVAKIDRVRRTVKPLLAPHARVFSIGLQDYISRSWAADYQREFPAELKVLADTKHALPMLAELLGDPSQYGPQTESKILKRYAEIAARSKTLRESWKKQAEQERGLSPVTGPALALELWNVLKGKDFVLANGYLQNWTHRIFDLEHPRQYLGRSGGGGLGYGIGATIGACLAHRHSGKLIVDIQSDGDFMFTPGGLWTLAHYRLPALIVMDNNRSYYNSEEHQTNIARLRKRDTKRAVTGTLLQDPVIDYAQMAQSMGVKGIGPIERAQDIGPALREAIEWIEKQGTAVVVDIVTCKAGY